MYDVFVFSGDAAVREIFEETGIKSGTYSQYIGNSYNEKEVVSKLLYPVSTSYFCTYYSTTE